MFCIVEAAFVSATVLLFFEIELFNNLFLVYYAEHCYV